ncbi:hypothetical protein [Paenibacillus tarimensis]|uniref:hypothetical protein n=1 Tax=Paenibacillus tarimensis TaxID=416012 RepID=UPI001F26A52A|nr:hypothetical protein [Paenibacillus tarimensis]MCF2943548.1 hypothetical protein [Paenibacillus tarimensis]
MTRKIPGNHTEIYEPFNLPRDQVSGITIFLGGGSDEVVANLKEPKELEELYTILQGASSYSGAAPADWPYTIVIKLNDEREREVEVTGNGFVFIDKSTDVSYSLDKGKFNDFLAEDH